MELDLRDCFGEETANFQLFLAELHKTGPEVIKLFSMLNSTEHGILNAYKYENIKKFSIFLGSDKPRLLFFLLINI